MAGLSALPAEIYQKILVFTADSGALATERVKFSKSVNRTFRDAVASFLLSEPGQYYYCRNNLGLVRQECV